MAFNTEQLEAINCNDRTIICLAGAGAGKSTTMVTRLKRLIDEGTDPHSILALTFTNAAAFEMGEKYKHLPGVHGDTPEFRTFHSFCYSLLIKDRAVREKLGYAKVPTVCDDRQLKELKVAAKLKTNCRLSEAQLSNPKSLSKTEKFEYDLYMKAYKQAIKEENVITFDMLCYNVCELFVRGAPQVQRYKEKYRYVSVNSSAPLC